MPQVYAGATVAVKAWLALGTAAKVASVAVFALKTAAVIAISYGLNRMMTRRLGRGVTSGSPFQMSREPDAPRKLIYGEARVSGPIAFAHVSGSGSEYLHLVIPLANHFCWEIGEIYFNDEPLGLPWGGGEVPPSGKYAGFVRVKKHRGEQTTADSDLVAEAAGYWTTDHVGLGVAYIYVRIKWDANVFPGGIPNISAVVKGKMVNDPRDATDKYSSNVALCLNDYLRMSAAEGGMGCDAEEVNVDSVIDAANVCDIAVALDAGGSEPQYACNGVIEINTDPQAIIDELTTAMAGKVYYASGQIVIQAGGWRTPEVSLNESCLR